MLRREETDVSAPLIPRQDNVHLEAALQPESKAIQPTAEGWKKDEEILQKFPEINKLLEDSLIKRFVHGKLFSSYLILQGIAGIVLTTKWAGVLQGQYNEQSRASGHPECINFNPGEYSMGCGDFPPECRPVCRNVFDWKWMLGGAAFFYGSTFSILRGGLGLFAKEFSNPELRKWDHWLSNNDQRKLREFFANADMKLPYQERISNVIPLANNVMQSARNRHALFKAVSETNLNYPERAVDLISQYAENTHAVEIQVENDEQPGLPRPG